MAGYGYEGYAPPPHAPNPYASTYGGYAPPPAAAAYGAPAPYATDEIRTIFVTGFPEDVKERELNNLLRFLPGYEASQMNFKNGQAQGFGLFATGAHGRAAIDALNHQVFDTENSVLRCEMAKKNMYVRDEPSMKRPRYGAPDPYATFPPGTAPPPGASYPPSGGGSRGDNPPCNTLFVGNLNPVVTEAELMELFSPLKGYRQLRLNRGPKATTCFVEFEDIESATEVHTSQQGAMLPSSGDRGGVRIQFSKNPFGSRKRDAQGLPIATY